MFAKPALRLAGIVALAGAAACDTDAGAAQRPAAAAVVRPVVVTADGAPAVRLGGSVVLTAARAEAATRFAIRQRADLRGRQVYLIDAPGGGSACPMRYVVLTVAGGRGTATPPFGNCSSRARLVVQGDKIMVSMPGFSNIGAPGRGKTYSLKGDRMTPADDDATDTGAAALGAISYQPTFRCAPGTGSVAAADTLLAKFEAEYPKDLVNPARVDLREIAPATLKRLVADLSCLAAQPGGDPFVPEQAAALFASRRHGSAAFAALAALGQAGDAAATRFGAQMRAYVAPR